MKYYLPPFAVGIAVSFALIPVDAKGQEPAGDWPMVRGNLLRSNRADVKGAMTGSPELAWRHRVATPQPIIWNVDLDGDGQLERYAAENWRIIRRDNQGQIHWKSQRITRAFTLVAFEDLDGDGTREPLMFGSGLNPAGPLYFVFDPQDGRIRWKQELPPSNGGDVLFGKLDPTRKGLQLVRALFTNPGGGELHFFCWDKGVEAGYRLWSWKRSDDGIYFPQLVLGDLNHDGRHEILMLSHMCVWAFDTRNGDEIGRIAWGSRGRSYGGHFGVARMKSGEGSSILVASAFHRVSVIDMDDSELSLRWDRPFEPDVGDSDLQGKLEFLHDGLCDLDGDGWAEVVVNDFSGQGNSSWRVVVLGARDGRMLAELVGRTLVGTADLDGDSKTEVFVRNRGNKDDGASGPVAVARWSAKDDLEIVWTTPGEGEIVREPNAPEMRLARHPSAGDRVKLANGSRPGLQTFFVRGTDNELQAFEPEADGFRQTDVTPPPDRAPHPAGGATPDAVPEAPLAADFDGDGRNEVILRSGEGRWTVLSMPKSQTDHIAAVIELEGIHGNPLFADLDGDGQIEVIAVRSRNSEESEAKPQACLEVSRPGGPLLWRKTWPSDSAYVHTASMGGFAIPFVTVGHFTQRNQLDVAVCYAGEKAGGHTAVLDGRSGETIWDISKLYPTMYGTFWDRHPPVVFDYDRDGLDDLATVCQTVHYTVLRGKDGHQFLERPRNVTGQPVEDGGPLFPGRWAVGAMLAGADIDRDGLPEIAVVSSQSAVGVVRASGEALWSLNLSMVDQVPSPGCWAEVDGDGIPELVYLFSDGRIGVNEATTGAFRWHEETQSLGTIVAADIDGNGSDEILFSAEKGVLYCLADRGSPLNGSHIRWSFEFEGIPGPAVFADIDGDGVGEILVTATDGFLYCLK